MKIPKSISIDIRTEILIILIIVITICAVYLQVRGYSFFIFDDNVYVTENSHVQSGINNQSIRWAFSLGNEKPMYWHPVTWLSHMLDVQAYGLNPGNHHLFNLLIHIFNSVLLFIALRVMTDEIWKSAAVAFLFAIHPLNVESVAWISSRKTVLSTLFWILTMLFYAAYTKKPDGKKYLLILIPFTVGLMTKQMLITLPFVLFLLDFWPFQRIRMSAMDKENNENIHSDINNATVKKYPVFLIILEKVPFIALALLAMYIAALSMMQSQIFITFETVPLLLRFQNALVSYVSYILKMVWPIHLAVFYPFPKMVDAWKIVGSIGFLVTATVGAIYSINRKPYIFVGWFWFVGTLVPVLGFVQAGLWPSMADRWAYIPLIGLFIIVCWLLPDVSVKWKKKKYGMVIATGIVLTLFMFRTWHQVQYWSDSIALFEHTVNITNNNSVAHNNLGSLYAMNDNIPKAMNHFSAAYSMDPGNKSAGMNLGRAFLKTGRIKDAVTQYEKVFKMFPEDIHVIRNLSLAYAANNEYEKALSLFFLWIQLQPDNPEPYYYISNIYAISKRNTEALAWFKRSVDKGFNNWDAVRHNKNFNGIRDNEYFNRILKGD